MTQHAAFLYGYTNVIVNGVIIFVTILNFVVYKFRQLEEAKIVEQSNRFLSLSIRGLCYGFSLDQMQRATLNFSDELVMGRGGFGKVYKGTLQLGPTVVAIKRLQSMSSQGSREFRTEIEMLSKLRHSHLVSLIGYCDDGYEMILVYEFMPGGTLADHLYKRVRKGDKSLTPLTWIQRLKICIGAARGLDYLHTGTGIQHRVIHRDVKTSNILLDENLAAKISDFGLSKISPANQATTFVSTHVKGTFGYFDPYYFSTRRLTWRSDVYSFGVVLFEVLCGRPALDTTLDEEQIGLAGWAQHCFRQGLVDHIIDPNIKGEVFSDSLEAFLKIAIACIQTAPKHRPTMAEVVISLISALALQEKNTDTSEKITRDDNKDEDVDSKMMTSDDSQDEIDSSIVEQLEHENSTGGIVDIPQLQEKQSSGIKRFSAYFAVITRAIPAPFGFKVAPRQDVLSVIQHSSKLKNFTYNDLGIATRKFHPKCMIGQGAFGCFYKGWVKENTFAAAKWGTGLAIAVKRFNQGSQSHRLWSAEINYLGKLCHPNVVKLIGYCLQQKPRLLVYEFMHQGSLNDLLRNLNDSTETGKSTFHPLPWNLRLSIALGAAKGLAYLHSPEVNVILRDLHIGNILIDSKFNAKLSGFSLAKDGLENERTHVSTVVRGTSGFAAPEYMATGHLSMKCDIYGFGVVLLKILTGSTDILKVLTGSTDITGTIGEHGLVSWAKPYLTSESGISHVMDADIKGQYTVKEALRAFSLVNKCVSVDPKSRPDADEVVRELEQLHDLENSENIKSEALQNA